MLHVKAWFLIGLALCSLVTSSLAAPVAVVNQGFEDITGENQTNEFTFGTLNGWDLYDPGTNTSQGDGPTYFIGTLTPFEPDPVGNPGVYTYFPAGATEGERVGIAFNFRVSAGQGEYGLSQELDATLLANTTYTLEVEIGNIDSGTGLSGSHFTLAGFPGYRVELLAGGVMLEQDDNTLAGTIPDGEFATSVVSFTTGAAHDQLGQNLGILLVNLNQEDAIFPASALEVDFDDVRLDALTSTALPGDFDSDSDVDGADFLVWQRQGINGGFDLAGWRTGYGTGTPVAVASVGVPEPAAGFLMVLGVVAEFFGCLGGSVGNRRFRRRYSVDDVKAVHFCMFPGEPARPRARTPQTA